ncbi:CAAX geranylgeranyltransferase alpha subunit [Sporothrix epigloea]|uniref:Protein farnesyltransferase/geranylgeranyltransferase type-1 subunit alpha n=1 Tax=Sporothrix epigloea TaxID=1892477 RepID=A0ABP0DH37_9PEZI
MPPRSKATPKAKEATSSSSASKAKTSIPIPPKNVDERSLERYYQCRPYARTADNSGISALSPADRTAWASTQLIPTALSPRAGTLPNKLHKELWKHVNEGSLPLRCLSKPTPASDTNTPTSLSWGRDRTGRPIGDYSLEELRLRSEKRARLTALELQRQIFAVQDNKTEDDVARERQRRADSAVLRMELYGQRAGGSYAQDPLWDDVTPIALYEPEGALAAITYPEAYAEAVSYLRAVMTAPEYSARCLRLTEHVISLNPAHYTVWLYRFSLVSALGLPLEKEIEWLNGVALQNLKNYQIWHHRYLLSEHYYLDLAKDSSKVKDFARSEMDFLTTILAQDTKNYHVWSYRQYLVRKLGYWVDAERRSMEAFIQQDVRNNSAWSHRFFLVFSDPSYSTQKSSDAVAKAPLETAIGELNLAHDLAVPAEILDREIAYAQEQIQRAPQNESPWNYLRGVLAKGGRPLAEVEDFARQFVVNIGKDDGDEKVTSTHAMDVLAAVSAEKGDAVQSALYLQRLAEKWDPIRAGYWRYRQQQLMLTKVVS